MHGIMKFTLYAGTVYASGKVLPAFSPATHTHLTYIHFTFLTEPGKLTKILLEIQIAKLF